MTTPEFPEVLEKRLDDAMTLLQKAMAMLDQMRDTRPFTEEQMKEVFADYERLVDVVYPDLEDFDDIPKG